VGGAASLSAYSFDAPYVIRETSHATLLEHRSAREALQTRKPLLGAVRFDVLLRGMFRMLCSMDMMGVCQMRVMGSFLVVARFVMLGGFVVVARRMLMMFGCLRVMMGCFL
jgi:hypothetical protein